MSQVRQNMKKFEIVWFNAKKFRLLERKTFQILIVKLIEFLRSKKDRKMIPLRLELRFPDSKSNVLPLHS